MIKFFVFIREYGISGMTFGKQILGDTFGKGNQRTPILTGTCPASRALQEGAKGHNIEGNALTVKPRPLGRGAAFLTPPSFPV